MPQTFATPASLYEEQAAALANGESSYFGPTVIVAGVTWTWNGNYYYETAPGSPSAPFATFAALQAALPAGPSAGVGGMAWYLDPASPIGRYESMWKGAAWSDGYLPSSIALPGSPSNPFASLADVVAAYPDGPVYQRAHVGIDEYICVTPGIGAAGWMADIKTAMPYASLPELADGSWAVCPHIIGIGSFRVKRIAGLWRVAPGESIVMGVGPGGGGYNLTAAGTSTVVLDSGTIPAGIIKVGETWAVDTHAEKTTHVSGSDAIQVRWADTFFIGNNSQIPAAVGYHVGDVNVSWTSDTAARRRLSSGQNNDGASGAISTGIASINSDQTLSLAVTPGGAGNVIDVFHWALRRVS